MHTENYKVRYSETGEKLVASVPAVMKYLQDASINHSASKFENALGQDKENFVWLLAGWHVKINRFPDLHENISVNTWSTGFKNMYGYRNFHLLDNDNNILALASSVWLYYDYENMKFGKVSQEYASLIGEENIPVFDDDRSYKLKKEESYIKKTEITVLKSDIDSNNHVNNTSYISYIVNAFPDLSFTEFKIQYKKQARLGDKINVLYNFDTDIKKIILTDINDEVLILADIIK